MSLFWIVSPLLSVVLLMPSQTEAKPIKAPWTEYFGSYDAPAAWAGSVRGIGRGRTGVALMSSSTVSVSEKADALKLLEAQLRTLLQTRDVLMPVGGLGSGRDQAQVDEFMNMITADGGASWKQIVGLQASRLCGLPNGGRVYWQIGNEINSLHFSKTIRTWAGNKGRISRDDKFIIPYYVEYFFAPTVEALLSLSNKKPGETTNIHIMLGTIAGARRPGAREWLHEILDYEIKGLYAPALKGKRVADYVEIIGIHYLVTSEITSWRSLLKDLHKELRGKGAIRGIWATEELGKKLPENGWGAATGLKIAGRYLSWWAEQESTPLESRCFYWGWRIGTKQGTRAADALSILFDFIGPGRLDVNDRSFPELDNKFECYALRRMGDPFKVAIIAIPKDTTIGPDKITVPAQEDVSSLTATIHLFSDEGHSIETIQGVKSGKKWVLPMSKRAKYRDRSTLLVLIEKKTIREY